MDFRTDLYIPKEFNNAELLGYLLSKWEENGFVEHLVLPLEEVLLFEEETYFSKMEKCERLANELRAIQTISVTFNSNYGTGYETWNTVCMGKGSVVAMKDRLVCFEFTHTFIDIMKSLENDEKYIAWFSDRDVSKVLVNFARHLKEVQ